jgi:hypothetical protein
MTAADPPRSSQRRTSAATPLSIIAAFIALSEGVGGLAATLTAGGIQIAFTAFAIGFPVLVGAAFFMILWRRSYVLYPPQDFGADVDVKQYVEAMRHQAIGNQEVVSLIRSSIDGAIRSPEARALLSQVAHQTTTSQTTLENATAVLAERAVGQLQESVVTVDIREFSRLEGAPNLVLPFNPRQRAFTFLSAVYFHIADCVAPFAYGTQWALRDATSDNLLLPNGIDWSNHYAVASTNATVSELGISAGMRLRAVKLRTADMQYKRRRRSA